MCLWAKKLWRDEAGVVISAELVLILTIVVLGVTVGLVQVRNAVVAELHDLGLAFSHLNQSYGFSGFRGAWKPWCGWTSWTAGSSFIDLYEGGNLSYADIGFVDHGGAYHGGGAIFGGGCPSGGCHDGFAYGRLGTIVLADGTLIPISMVGLGTWSLPGGALLVEYSSHQGVLVLADGTRISYLVGGPGIVELAGGQVFAARPGLAGTVVLSDGRIATFSATDASSVALADGTTGRFLAADLDHVILGDGTSVAVKMGEAGTLVLPDGRVLRLSDATHPDGDHPPQPIPDQPAAPQGAVLPGDGVLPAAPVLGLSPHHHGAVAPDAPPIPQLPEGQAPGHWVPRGPVVPQFAPPPAGPRGLPTFRRWAPGRSLPTEIPAGPIPQNLPQV